MAGTTAGASRGRRGFSACGMVTSVLVVALAVQVGLFLYQVHSPQSDVGDAPPPPFTCQRADADAIVQRFVGFLRFPSVSNASAPHHMGDEQVFASMLRYLAEAYSTVWAELAVEEVGQGGHSRLITWRGSDATLRPALFISHYDVVPVTPGTERDWTHPPFEAKIADDFVWARGAADVKFGVAGLLEAATELLRQGYRPRRTLMFAFGHDEEVGGGQGAGRTAALLAERGVELDIVLDEGGVVLSDGIKPLTPPNQPVALVGTAEKGYSSVEVVLRSIGGHASAPPLDGSDIQAQILRLLTAIKDNPPPTVLQPPITDMLLELLPYAPPYLRPLLAACERSRSVAVNWLLGLVFRRLGGREMAAMVTTTVALTRVTGGVADNVLPQEAVLSFNTRLLPGSVPADSVSYMTRMAALARVQAEVRIVAETAWPGGGSNVTSRLGRHYKLLKRAIQETWRLAARESSSDSGGGAPAPAVFSDDGAPVAVAPMLLMGGTDSKHYAHLSRHGILRFAPYSLNKAAGELAAIHSTNERVRAADYVRGVCTYARMLQLFGDSTDG